MLKREVTTLHFGLLSAFAVIGCIALLAATPACAVPNRASGDDEEVRAGPSLQPIIFQPNDHRFRFLPLTNYVNTAFDTAQVSGTFSQDGYWKNHETVFEEIFDPHDSIKADGGYGKLLQQEFASSHVLPNITLHLLGNGYDFRALAEWFSHHGACYPYVWAFLSSYAGYVGNEAIEASNPKIDSLDHIADLYFFNLLGNFLFMSDLVADTAQNTLHMRNWVGQPFVDVRNGRILNASNNYVLRPALFGNGLRPFIYFGLHYLGGVSIALPDESSLSFGAGLATVDPLREGNAFADNLEKIQPSGGVFWDQDDRLLASVIFNSTDFYRVRANLYPDILRTSELDMGFFLGVSDDGTPSFGLTFHQLLALGFR